MKRVWLFVVVVFALVLFTVLGIYAYFLWNVNAYNRTTRRAGVTDAMTKEINDPSRDLASIQDAPEQLTTGFDPTQNSVFFLVTSIDIAQGLYHVTGMSPASWLGRTLTTTITCPPWDIQYRALGAATPQPMIAAWLPRAIGATAGLDVIISGLCKDVSCSEIKSLCQVNVYSRNRQ